MEKKYMDIQKFNENMGAGIENEIGPQELYYVLKTQLHFYEDSCHLSFQPILQYIKPLEKVLN